MDFYNSEEEKEPAYITAKARISPLVTLLNRSSPDGERKEIFSDGEKKRNIQSSYKFGKKCFKKT
ncbi:hypothetical protein KJ991_00525 [Patescibacteria group bacterium]|nr:hypothetical protein [Patescibacteria group bacterium]MBU4057516.1 hypothetical protein [Patescibacteria group bacterium]MBU4116012.1 hypothetical protein [Patescibacteria group bacterium]